MPALALPDPPLSDAVVALRGFDSRDVAAVTAACQDPEIPRWTLVPRPYGQQDAREHMRHMEAGRMAGTRLSLAIVEAAERDVLLGSIALNPIDWERSAADVGYWVAAPARGRGVATRAVRLVTDWAFGSLGLERMELRAQRENRASQAVAARAGFRPIDAPLIHRPECDHLPDVFFARLRRDG
jgi:RimJ/RimL family protein N-acetyltransferase